jgi:hypothetical protein
VAQASKRARRSKLAEVGEFGMSGLTAAVQLDVAWLADQRHSGQRTKRHGEAVVPELVANEPAFALGDYQAATA